MKKFILSLICAACMFTSCLTVTTSRYNSNVDDSAEAYKYVLHVVLNADANPEEFGKIQKKLDQAFADTRLTVVEDAESLTEEQQQSLLTYFCKIYFDDSKADVNLVLNDFISGKEVAKFECHDFDNGSDSSKEKCVDWLCDSIKNGFAK
ncbi:MAG: hypothetical protein IJL70_08685 [Treponema sp.]|nr:hypothetical protein [Treponema sp.]